jgi:hypothetical protein
MAFARADPTARNSTGCSGMSSMRSPAQRRNFKLGKWSLLYRLDWSTERGSRYDRDVHRKTSETHLYFPRRRRAFQSERIQRARLQSTPPGVLGRCPACSGETSIRQSRHQTPHVRMHSMPRATGIHRRSCERNYSGDATLAERAPTPPPQSSPPELAF